MSVSRNDSELRRGWPVILACFCVAVFAWGFGFYGQSVYLAELHRLKGWPTSVIAAATTAFYLIGACLMPFVHTVMQRTGPRVVLLIGVALLGVGACGFSGSAQVWQLFVAGAVMAGGWVLATGTAIALTLALWFDRQRGLALSLALNGASASGFTVAPILVHMSESVGLADTIRRTVVVGLIILVPIILLCLRHIPTATIPRTGSASAPGEGVALSSRSEALVNRRFWSVALPFALGIAAQVGFIIHMIAFLLPRLGAAGTSLAVSMSSLAAMGGRLSLGVVVDRLPLRGTSAASFLSQACGLCLMLAIPDRNAVLYIGVILFGLSVGNVITLPAILVQREFAPRSFGLVVALSAAITQFTLALAPGAFGVLHDLAGDYRAVLVACMALQLTAAVLVLNGPDRQRRRRNRPNAARVASDT